jgi:hypothetical protein
MNSPLRSAATPPAFSADDGPTHYWSNGDEALEIEGRQ